MNYIELEKWTLEGLDVDYVPLDNIVRPFAADMFTPKEHEFELALSFLKELLEKYKETGDPQLKEEIMRQIQRLKQRMMELMAKMSA